MHPILNEFSFVKDVTLADGHYAISGNLYAYSLRSLQVSISASLDVCTCPS